MTLLDIILILIVFSFALSGFWFGFIHSIGALLGLVLGAWFAGNFYVDVGGVLLPYVRNEGLANVIGFFLIFIILNKGIGLLFSLINRIFNILTFIPFLKSINRLLGAIMGLIEGTLAVGLIIYVAARFPISQAFSAALLDSQVSQWLIERAALLAPLLPDLLNKLKTVI